jgi:hypothetical protein
MLFCAIGLFFACDNPAGPGNPFRGNPFSNNLGEKVTVEPPTINVTYPVSGSFLVGTEHFEGTAKAYFEVRKVEVYVFANEANGQSEVPWTDRGITMSGDIKNKTWTMDFNTLNYNSGNDGSIRMKFRVTDTSTTQESVEFIYIIKNKPSEVRITSPDAEKVKSNDQAKIRYKGEINGQIIDRRGLKPGYPQIKFWPVGTNPGEYPIGTEPADNDPDWGWATLFLPGTGSASAGYDKPLDYGGVDSNGDTYYGVYADRKNMPVVRTASFSLKLAEYTIEVDPQDSNIRRIRYKEDPLFPGTIKYLPAGGAYSFRIKTQDTMSDSRNMQFPVDNPPTGIPAGYFPPEGYGESWEDKTVPRTDPANILIFNDGARPEVSLNNDDVLPTYGVSDPKDIPNPHHYIIEPTSRKIADESKTGAASFRLRILADVPSGGSIDKTVLEYEHTSTGKKGSLIWDSGGGGNYSDNTDNTTKAEKGYTGDVNPAGGTGKIFTFKADGSANVVPMGATSAVASNTIFITSSEPYTLRVRVWFNSGPEYESPFQYTLYMDGEGPEVSIRSIKGAASDTTGSAGPLTSAQGGPVPGGLINTDPYTVNGNIQVVVDRIDTGSSIMAYDPNGNMGPAPTGTTDMVKWVVEEDTGTGHLTAAGTILDQLRYYQTAPDEAKLQFFKNIDDTRSPSPRGWVRLPIAGATIDADKANHFKLNTSGYDQKTLWLYVIAMDRNYNLGFVMQQIYVDDSTDFPIQEIPLLSQKNAGGTQIISRSELYVAVGSYPTQNPHWTGNWNTGGGPNKNNILEDGQGIELQFLDDDGIDLDTGVTIKLTNQNPPASSTEVQLTSHQVKDVLKAGNKRDWSGVLSQKVMAEVLGIPGDRLEDGVYTIEIEVTDDVNEKVAITPHVITGDTPAPRTTTVKYWFAVYTKEPEIEITFPQENAWGSSKTLPVYGTVKSRLDVQSLWIMFNPTVTDGTGALLNSTFKELDLYEIADTTYSTPVTTVTPDANGYYIYRWKVPNDVIFNPTGLTYNSPSRTFSVTAFDQLANRGVATRNVQIDEDPPDVFLQVNNRIPEDNSGVLYLYGKVSFTVSASDDNGLMQLNGYEGIKWWVYPYTGASTDTVPDWNTPPPTYNTWEDPYHTAPAGVTSWTGYGNFRLNQVMSGKYTGIIDTRWLPKGKYRLYVIAIDTAGNETDITTKENVWPKFEVDQSFDLPEITGAHYPEDDTVQLGGETIKGMAYDADLFDPAKLGTYVAGSYVWIRFPAGANAGFNAEPTLEGHWDTTWYPVVTKIPDSSGAIAFEYNTGYSSVPANIKYYFGEGGTKYYQIMVADEPNHKNPDKFMDGNPLYEDPPGTNYPYVQHGAVSRIFPRDISDPTDPDYNKYAYSFIVDSKEPEIFFNSYDPSNGPGHTNYSAIRPTFSKYEQLLDALGGWVVEDKLVKISMNYNIGNGVPPLDADIMNDPPNQVPAGTYYWNIKINSLQPERGGLSTADLSRLKLVFEKAEDGMQIIEFTAEDKVLSHKITVPWLFSKDTKGPEIRMNIARSIKRTIPSNPGSGVTAWPSDWGVPSSDWRYGTAWQTAWTTAWKDIIENWPSEYAFLQAADIITKLNNENTTQPSMVTSNVIEGTFLDTLSYVRIQDPPGTPTPTPTYFYYRFRDYTGKLLDIPAGKHVTLNDPLYDPPYPWTSPDYDTYGRGDKNYLWMQKTIEDPAGQQAQNERSADWKITLDDEGGFTWYNGDPLPDGEYWFDIRVKDTAGNISEIFNIRFLVDSAPPVLGTVTITDDPSEFEVDITGGPTWAGKALNVEERVFSSVGIASGSTGENNEAFKIQGTISDSNLTNLKIVIRQEGDNNDLISSSVEINPLYSSAAYGVSGTGTSPEGLVPPAPNAKTGVAPGAPAVDWFDTASDPAGTPRLTVSAPVRGYTLGTDYSPDWTWTWTLTVRQKDIALLRTKNTSPGARRYIRVTASDNAGRRVGPADWYFYLDTIKPEIEYINLDPTIYTDPPPSGTRTTVDTWGSSFEANVALSGLASDDTTIKDVQFMIGKWSYAADEWQWWNGSAWTPSIPATPASWPSALTGSSRQTSMNWSITQKLLDDLPVNPFPPNMLNAEGRYRLDLYVTDYSLGNGNAHYTYNASDYFDDYGYNKSNQTTNMSGRVFHIDEKDPELKWADDDTDYYKNDANGQVTFEFTTEDGNTINRWMAQILDDAKPPNVIFKGDSNDLTSPATSPGLAHPDTLDKTETGEQSLRLKPYMTVNGAAGATPLGGGLALDIAAAPPPPDPPPKTYTITVTVYDGADRTSTISKQFVLDNTPPALSGFRPESDNLEANAGSMNISGNTSDNSNQLKKVAFYVPPVGTTYPYTINFPNPSITTDIPDTAWKWFDPSDATGSKAKIEEDSTTVMEINGGTFAWQLMLPRTSAFLDMINAKKYVQWTKTGGEDINGVIATAGSYRDVTLTYNSTTQTCTVSTANEPVPALTFQDLTRDDGSHTIYGGEDVGLITVYMLAEDRAGNRTYEVLKYWIWPEGDRPNIISINSPDSSKLEAERLLNGTIRLSGMARDNEQVKYVWFRVLKKDGTPYVLDVPVWDETDWGKPGTGTQGPKNGSVLGSRKSTEPAVPDSGGWYMANGGGSKDVTWYAYINSNGELDPKNGDTKNEITIEVLAQDVTWDDTIGSWKIYTASYRGFASIIKKVDAIVVAEAPIFENVLVANGTSEQAADPNVIAVDPNDYVKWVPIDTASIRGRSSYKVTVKHTFAVKAISWSPTKWDTTLNSFQSESTVQAFNLIAFNPTAYPAYKPGMYVYQVGTGYQIGNQAAAFAALSGNTPATSMAVKVEPRHMETGPVSSLSTTKSYLIINWDPSDTSLVTSGVFVPPDNSYYEPGKEPGNLNGNPVTLKDLKNTIFTPSLSSGNIGNAVILEAETEGAVDYYKWDVIVDVRADSLLAALPANYENLTAGRYKNSVRYPVYLSATDNSKASQFTTRGDTLLPIDNRDPYAMYTLNRKAAGPAATIGGEAGDDGPVAGVARVVLWFEQKGTFISWHDQANANTTLLAGTFTEYTGGGPAWWDGLDPGVIPALVKKPQISLSTPLDPTLNPDGGNYGTGGDSAIVIDKNSPSVGLERWGHKLPTGFADGGMGKYWYVEINSYGIESGPVTLHYVVIDKAGNAKYYKEKLVIMNDAPKISKVKLATDIRHNAAYQTLWPANTGGFGYVAGSETNPILKEIRDRVPLGTPDVEKGISDWVDAAVGLGINKIIDFNVRNSLFGVRVETTAGPGTGKTRNFRLEYVSGATLWSNATVNDTNLAQNMKAGRVYIIENPGTARWGAIGAEGDGPWQRGYTFLAAVDGYEDGENKITGTGSVWELNSAYPAIGERTGNPVPATLRLGDVKYTGFADPNAKGAEFVYSNGAFGTTQGSSIIDFTNDTDAILPAEGVNPVTGAGNSMFIVRVFDGPEADIFSDFTIIRVRVNNNDRTKPFAQLYDLNPKTEGQDRANIASNEQERSVSPMFVGERTGSNRTKGGLWNTAPAMGAVTKPGHIEPRRMNSAGGYNGNLYNTTQNGETAPRNHSLSSAQMGGAATQTAATIQKPWANPAGFFTTDTVSGQVVLRGYAEDDQRIQRVDLLIGGQTVNILTFQANSNNSSDPGYGTASNTSNYISPKTGLLAVPTAQAGKVYFADSIDLYRHRVEWAYIWDTETVPANTVVGNVTVRVTSYNRDALTTNGKTASDLAEAPGTAHSNISLANKPNTSPYNPDFPAGLYEYNQIAMNIRPYITGFLRNQASNNTRSRQGRYMFYREETAVVTGFNLGNPGTGTAITASISLPGMANTPAVPVTANANYGITAQNNARYRQFTVYNDPNANNGARTGDGLVTLTVNSQPAVNTGSERARTTNPVIRPTYIQPWNIEYSLGTDGSELWDDFTQVHIWQSNGNEGGSDRGRFNKGSGLTVFDPSMSIDPATGTLWESHNEGGGSGWNTGSTKVSSNNGDAWDTQNSSNSIALVANFIDPIMNSDIFISTRPSGRDNNTNKFTVWTAFSATGRSGQPGSWRNYGGLFISGPEGGAPQLDPGGGSLGGGGQIDTTANYGFGNTATVAARSKYIVESTGYNAGVNTAGDTNWPPGNAVGVNSRIQFKNPHIVTYWGRGTNTGDTGTDVEHVHVSYYDDKDGSLKYRYNRRGGYGNVDWGTGLTANSQNTQHYAWTNLDGGWDLDDQNAFNADNNNNWGNANGGGWYKTPYNTYTGQIAQGGRIVGNPRAGTAAGGKGINNDVGEHNSIALTSQGYPVIAYYDKSATKLKLAISSVTVPIGAQHWAIRDVFPASGTGVENKNGTGEYVSIKIETRATNAALGIVQNTVHIAALNSMNKTLVYIKGTLNGQTFNFEKAQVVDSVGSVGQWCALSLDSSGNPWISYLDEGYKNSRDGVKLAYYNKDTFYKGDTVYFNGQDQDINKAAINGWEAMHIPTRYKVESVRLGMECYPAVRLGYNGTAPNKFWGGAVGYLGEDYYRVAYYVK